MTIQSAVSDPTCESINLTGALYQENVVINRNVTISGQSPTTTVVDGGGLGPVFRIERMRAVTVSELTIQNGRSDYGGGIYLVSENKLTLVNSVVQGNQADNVGGGIYESGIATITLVDSIFVDNSACGEFGCAGGAIYFEAGTLAIADTEFISNSASSGGALYNSSGQVTITNSILRDNSASTTIASAGGAVYNFGRMRIVDSWFMDNQAEAGGAIFAPPESPVSVTGSTFDGNSASNQGGAIWNAEFADSPLSVEFVNSTFSGNRAENEGGAIFIYQFSRIRIINSTLTENWAGDGGGVFNMSGTVHITNTIVANNLGGGDCGGTLLTSHGNNIDSDGSCGLNDLNDSPKTNPYLGPLKDNGGQTPTHALSPLSPAIDTGSNSACPPIDQRGVSRPFDGDGDLDPACDIGAYELDLLFNERIYLPFVNKAGS